MDIKKAKQQIKNAIIAYSTEDKFGNYKIPVVSQRPVFLVGAPGIGKTAIMEQIANELDVSFVSYSMTHHTRQSALGLPFIIKKKYGEQEYSVSEYTMSEIIASVYEEIEKTGKDKGILFLDEINCVSETLAPSMLQFLQYKTFGRHQIPNGWIVVTAGNPPEYNNSVREFDIAMLDRLKKIEVEPDFDIWKEYAINTMVHPVITSYLTIKPNHFYRIVSTVDGKSFVTARSWDDLNMMIKLYEENNLEVDYDLIIQYVQDEEIAKDFANYYMLYRKYKSDYNIEEILNNKASKEIMDRALNAKFDERLSLISLIISKVTDIVSETNYLEEALTTVIKELDNDSSKESLSSLNDKYQELANKTDTKDNSQINNEICSILNDLLSSEKDVKALLKEKVLGLKEKDQYCQSILDNVFTFFENVFKQGQELLILVTELTVNNNTSSYIFKHGCPKYYQHNKQLLFEDKHHDLKERIDSLNLKTINSGDK